MSQKRPRSLSPSDYGCALHWSKVIEDRASSFKAVYSTTVSRDHLRSLTEFKGASHLITAWRQPSSQRSLVGDKTLYTAGHDDDGEQYAGKKLENLLEDLNVGGVLVVARWYGGIMLGPVRFTHILDCAREAIHGWNQAEAEKRKRQKLLREETEQKPQLIALLKQRDESIAALRGLLAEKQNPKDSKTKPIPLASNPSLKIEYGTMELQTLKRLEKARDATIGFILAQIDKAESDQPP